MSRILKSGFVVVLLLHLAECDYYSSVKSLERLLAAESRILDKFENFLSDEQFKNSLIEQFLDQVNAEHEIIESQPSSYFGNPINAFRIIKRVARDWKNSYHRIAELTNARVHSKAMEDLDLDGLKYEKPSLTDFQGAAKGIARLQNTYQLSATDLAAGILMNRKVSKGMTSRDCYELGAALSQEKDYKNAAYWLIEARSKFRKEKASAADFNSNLFALNEDIIWNQLVYATLNGGNNKLAAWMARKKLQENRNHTTALEILDIVSKAKQAESIHLDMNKAHNKTPKPSPSVNELYEQLCRGQLTPTPAVQRPLRCRYQNNDVPFRLIGPFRVEELSLDPYVAVYYEAIDDAEIGKIITAARPNMYRSKVGAENVSVVSEVRTSQNSWLYHHQHEFLEPLLRRLQDMTGLNIETAEALQVANYGIGGHYAPHEDFIKNITTLPIDKGNRILTALLYVNDVELGGATVFPFLRLAVPPIKRSLVLWYNLHRSSHFDYRTRHAGCPVLKGSKWICNEWFRERGQEFTRPCDRHYDGYKSIEYATMT